MCYTVLVRERVSSSMLANLFGTTWACVGVASEPSFRDEEDKTGRQSARKRANPHGKRVRGGSPENAGADAVGDVRLAPASRLG